MWNVSRHKPRGIRALRAAERTVDELDITALATDGRGVARPEGRPVVFVARALPGERVRARMIRQRSSFGEAEIEDILVPSAERRAAPCPWFSRCGGCTLQQLSSERQLAAKRGWLLETLRRVGRWSPEALAQAEACLLATGLADTGYRQRVRAHFDGRNLGFCERSSHRIVPVCSATPCLVAAPLIQRHWDDVRNVLCAWAEGLGQVRVEIELTETIDGRLVLEPVAGPQLAELRKRLGQLPFAHCGDVFEVPHPFWGSYQVHRESFVQPHVRAVDAYATALRADLEDWFAHAALKAPCIAWDLYAGSGPFSLLAADAARGRVAVQSFAVEGIAAAMRAAERNCAGKGTLTTVCRDVREFLADGSLELPAVVIADPPRAGLGLEFSEELAGRLVRSEQPVWFGYVACSPAALARDVAAFLARGFVLRALHLYDAFPQTEHYEAIAILTHRKDGE